MLAEVRERRERSSMLLLEERRERDNYTAIARKGEKWFGCRPRKETKGATPVLPY
jgi:hypothetical protein